MFEVAKSKVSEDSGQLCLRTVADMFYLSSFIKYFCMETYMFLFCIFAFFSYIGYFIVNLKSIYDLCKYNFSVVKRTR